MQLCDLIDAVTEEIAVYPELHGISTASIIKLLNEGQEEMARELDIPRLYVQTDTAARIITLPEGLRSNGLMWFEDNLGRPYQIYTINEANQLFPQWETAEFGGVVVYNAHSMPRPPNPSLHVLPKDATARFYRLEVAMRPMIMSRMEDSPFQVDEDISPTLSEFHIGLAYYAIWRLVVRAHSEAAMAKAPMFHAAYKKVKEGALSESLPDSILPKRRLYSEGLWRSHLLSG